MLSEMVFINLNSRLVLAALVHTRLCVCLHTLISYPKIFETKNARTDNMLHIVKTMIKFIAVNDVEKEAFKCFKLMLDSDSIKLNQIH